MERKRIKPRTLITIRVKSPTVMDPKKLKDIEEILTNRIVDPFRCDYHINYAFDVPQKGVLSFYIFRRGKLKKSVAYKLIETLTFLDKYWPDMIGYLVENVRTEDV